MDDIPKLTVDRHNEVGTEETGFLDEKSTTFSIALFERIFDPLIFALLLVLGFSLIRNFLGFVDQ